jgi:alkylation response protein AidB-like acyl-CoA dehydrogenase
MDTPGITVRPFRQANGSLEFAEVFLDEVRVPPSLLVGNEGDGWRIAMSTVSLERGPADAGLISDLRRNLGGLARSQAVRLRSDGDMTSSLVRAFVDVEVLRVHVLRSLSARARGLGSEFDVSVDKLLLIRAEQELAHATMDLYGAAPLLGSRPDVLSQYFWSRSASVYGGSQEIQRTIVATRLLGLPRS